MRQIRSVRNLPLFPVIPLVPLLLFVGSVVASARAIMRVRRLERRLDRSGAYSAV